MSNEVQTAIANYRDEKGRKAKTKFQFAKTNTLAETQGLWDIGLPLLKAITGCGVKKTEITAVLTGAPNNPQTVAGTNTAMDKIVWRFLDVDGNTLTFTTPAPLAADMQTDDYHVLDTQADILAFINWCIAYLRSPYGKALTGFIDAVRQWRNRKAKNS